jgi:3-hydroxy-9,10-secoandrosta-1,3,5(10)-triene-9,17-dione monooxygenase reductase component
MPPADASPLARALGRIPSALYIVSTLRADQPVGFVGSLVQQVGFEPPTLTLAVAREREPLRDLRLCGRFSLTLLDAASRSRMGLFLKHPAPGSSPYDGLALGRTPAGIPYLAEGLAWFDCRIVSEHPSGDHVVLFAEVEAAATLHEGEPHVHLRRNGLSY